MNGWRLGNSVAVTKTPFGSSKITLRLTNSQGFSSSGDFNFFYNKEKQDDLYRVIILGGSTVEGDGAEDISSNLASHLKKRLSKRNSDSISEINFRMSKALKEIKHFDEYDYVLVNDNLDNTFQNIVKIIEVERLKLPKQLNLSDFVKKLNFT